MSDTLERTSVKGGSILRKKVAGKFVSVTTAKGTSRSASGSVLTLRDVSQRRAEALKRLADR